VIIINYSFNTSIDAAKLPKPMPPAQSAFVQNPPYPIGFWIKKLKSPGPRGENMIFKVKYESDAALPPKIDYYQNGTLLYTLLDDGTYTDDVAGDKKFACLKKEDFTKLKAEINALQSTINTQGHVIHFTGHSGEVVLARDMKQFDVVGFDNGVEVEVNALLIDAADCATEIKPEKSLFITDLSVVEDQTRTYNVFTGVGNPTGAWTFGTLMANIENGTHADGVRGFLKDWVKNWTISTTIQGELVIQRDFVIETFIAPWLKKANNNLSLNVTHQNWESLWNATPQTAIRNTAPFKLTTIVNRLDLRGSSAYTPGLENAGETRFIYTLVNPLTGEVPINPNQTISAQHTGVGFGDWRGLNVILEYGNVQTTSCEAQHLAQMWLNLSESIFPLGNASTDNIYKSLLQNITDLVTSANSNTNRPNGSAIHRIRTNEKLFPNGPPSPVEQHLSWGLQDWEFRQFEIDPGTHKLKLVPLTNTPPITSNHAININMDFTSNNPSVTNNDLLDWIYNGHMLQVKHGNYNLPANLLTVSALVTGEGAHYLDFKSEYWQSKRLEYQNSNYNNPEYIANQIRQQFSLNSCIGCHTGETKTRFTHVNPVKYGESTRYWLAIPDGNNLIQDETFYPWSTGVTGINGKNIEMSANPPLSTPEVLNYDVNAEIVNQNFFQAVSPFLVGRRYRSYLNGLTNWQDDELDDENLDNINIENADNSRNGLFYVNSPANMYIEERFPFVRSKKWGYNDLLNRKNKLCQFLLSNCGDGPTSNNPTAIGMITQISFIPFPLASH